MRIPRLWIIGSASAATVRGLVVKNGRPALLTAGEEGDYPALRVSGGYLVAGETGRKVTITNGQIVCNDSAST